MTTDQPTPNAAPTEPALPAVSGWRLPPARNIAFVVAVVVVCATIAIYLLPRQPLVTRSAEIAAPPDVVFALVSDLRRLPAWSPWLDGVAASDIVYTGPTDGVGQAMMWPGTSPQGLSGHAVITASEPGRKAEMTVDPAGQRAMLTSFDVVAQGQGTRVIWRLRPDLGFNPVDRVLGLWADGRVGAELERGLARLKAVAEAPPSG